MSNFVTTACRIFAEAVRDYHRTDDVDAPMPHPYPEGSIEQQLYHKCWIDAVQWHLEDLIRDPEINPEVGMALKRRIDRSNQDRTDRVEDIDSYFLSLYQSVTPLPDARINTESPGWAIDRLSILHLKLWHIDEQVQRPEISEEQRQKCRTKQTVLQQQLEDMTTSISELLDDYAAGRRIMRVYRQMKLYNDPNTNPVLYAAHSGHPSGSRR